MRGLVGKKIVCTGVSSEQGLGYAAAQRLLEEGCDVIITANKQQDVDAMVINLTQKFVVGEQEADRVRVRGYLLDFCDKDSISQCVEQIKTDVGTVHGLYNNIGLSISLLDSANLPLEEIQLQINVNLTSTIWFTNKMLPLIQDNGSIVFCTSCLARHATPNIAVYSATKAGLEQFARVLSVEMKQQPGRNIRVNTLAPGSVQTQIYDHLELTQEIKDYIFATSAQRCDLNRCGLPVEIAGPLAFLMSDDASFITGATLSVDGGFH